MITTLCAVALLGRRRLRPRRLHCHRGFVEPACFLGLRRTPVPEDGSSGTPVYEVPVQRSFVKHRCLRMRSFLVTVKR